MLFFIQKVTAEIILNRLHFDCSKVYSSEMERMISSDNEKFYDEADLEKAHDNAWLKSFSLVCWVLFFLFIFD